MPAIVWVVIAIVVLVGALLAVDWFTAGRTKGRILVRAKDQNATNEGVGYGQVMRAGDSLGHQSQSHP